MNKNRTVLVTGSTKGIGRSIAESFISNGDQVIIHGRKIDQVQEIAKKINAHGAIGADLSHSEGCQSLIDQAASIGPIDVLVNNTGIFEVKDFFDTTDDDWERYFQVNIMSAVRLSRHFMKSMLENNAGAIINIASEAGFKPLPQMIHYSVSKTALISLSRGLAEITKGTKVRVNSLLPGPTWTEGVEQYFDGLAKDEGKDVKEIIDSYFKEHEPTSLIQRFVDVKEVADATLLLANNEAINGSSLRVEGGIIRTL